MESTQWIAFMELKAGKCFHSFVYRLWCENTALMRCEWTSSSTNIIQKKLWTFANDYGDKCGWRGHNPNVTWSHCGKKQHFCIFSSELWRNQRFWCVRIFNTRWIYLPSHPTKTTKILEKLQTMLFVCVPELKAVNCLRVFFLRMFQTNWTLLRTHAGICQNKWSFIRVFHFILRVQPSVLTIPIYASSNFPSEIRCSVCDRFRWGKMTVKSVVWKNTFSNGYHKNRIVDCILCIVDGASP